MDSKKMASWMRHVFTLLHLQILISRQMSSILPRMQECEMKICIVPINGFLVPKLDWHLPKLGRKCCISKKTTRKNELALLITFACSDFDRPDSGSTSVEG